MGNSNWSRTLLLLVTLGLVFIFILGPRQIGVGPSPRVPIVVPTKV